MTTYRLLEMIRNVIKDKFPNNRSKALEDVNIIHRQTAALQEVINLHNPQSYVLIERSEHGEKVKTIRSTCLECLEPYPCHTALRMNGKLGIMTQNAITTPHIEITVQSSRLRIRYQRPYKILDFLDRSELDEAMISALNSISDSRGKGLQGLQIGVCGKYPDRYWDRTFIGPNGTAVGSAAMTKIMYEVDDLVEEALEAVTSNL